MRTSDAAGRHGNTTYPRSRAPETPASQMGVLPIPASPHSAKVAAPPPTPSRSSTTADSSSSRPTTSTMVAILSPADDAWKAALRRQPEHQHPRYRQPTVAPLDAT